MKLQDLLDAGYKRFSTNHDITHKYSSFGLQKLISDESGKRYYITVYVYDETYIGGQYLPQRFSPSVQFRNKDDKPVVDMELLLNDSTSLAEVEDMFAKAWEMIGRVYYSYWDC